MSQRNGDLILPLSLQCLEEFYSRGANLWCIALLQCC